MRKYIATDESGRTATGHKLEPGKFIENAGSQTDPLSRISDDCCDSPLLAVLTSPFPAGKTKMFMINRWKVAVEPVSAQSYTVIKEVASVPSVNVDQKLIFALVLIKKIYKDSDFRDWAGKWLSGEDRTAASAEIIKKATAEHIKAAADLRALKAQYETDRDDEEIVKLLDDIAQRALHVVTAAELAAGNSQDAEQAAREVSRALIGIGCFGRVINLVTLAEKVVRADAAIRPPSDPLSVAG